MLAQRNRIHVERFGDAIHVRFDGEDRLRRTEAAECAVGRSVGEHRAAANACVVAAIRAGGVNAASRHDHRTQRDVCAAVENDVDVHRDDGSIALHAGAMAHDGGMSLGRGDHVLGAVVDDLHGPSGLEREQCRVSGDHGRILFLAAESAAGLGLHDANVRVLAEEALECLHDIEGTLNGAVNGDAALLRNGDDTIRLDVDVLLMSRAVGAFDDHVRGREAGVEVPLVDRERLEDDRGVLGIELRLELFVFDDDVSREELLAILVRQQHDRLGEMPNLRLDEEGLIVFDERDDVVATGGNVAVVHDGEARGVEVAADVRDASARNGRADGPPVQHSRKGEVVGVLGAAGRLADPILTRDAGANCRHLNFLATVQEVGSRGRWTSTVLSSSSLSS